jgi:hypothetical protein
MDLRGEVSIWALDCFGVRRGSMRALITHLAHALKLDKPLQEPPT